MNENTICRLSILVVLSIFQTHPVYSQQLITTNADSCSATDPINTSILGGTSQNIIDSAIAAWQNLGFNIGTISPNENILVCGDGSRVNSEFLITPEQAILDKAASSPILAIEASIIQTTNLYTRLASLRNNSRSLENNIRVTDEQNPNEFGLNMPDRENRRIGAGSDQSTLLDQQLSVFVNGYGNFGDQKASARSNGFDFDTIATTIGVDYRLDEHFLIGTAFGYTNSHSQINRGLGDLEADTYSLSLFGGYSLPEGFYIDALARVGWSDYQNNRNFLTDENTLDHVTSDYEGNDYSVSLTAGYSYNIDAFIIRPIFRYDYVHTDIDSFTEATDSFVHNIGEQHVDSMRTTLGTWLSYAISTPYGVVTPMMRAEWQHEYLNNSRMLTLVQADSLNRVSQLQTNSPDRDFFNLGFGLTATLPHGVSGFFFYETMVGNSYTTVHSFNGGIRMEF